MRRRQIEERHGNERVEGELHVHQGQFERWKVTPDRNAILTHELRQNRPTGATTSNTRTMRPMI